jgi:hypothetical protein
MGGNSCSLGNGNIGKYLRKSQLWSEDFTAKLFCNVEFWMERLPKLIEPQLESDRLAAMGNGSRVELG